MNMKKTFAGCLILIAVLALAIVSAGCVNQPSGDEQGIDVPDVSDIVRLDKVEKTGTTYSIGDTMEVILTIRDGMKLYVKECDDGISIDSKEISVNPGDKEISCVKFTITALKEGNHAFQIGIDHPLSEVYGFDDVIYEDTMHVVDTGDEPMTPRGVFTRISYADHPPYSGEFVEISIRGNATTGYKWVAAENKDLIISEPVYIPDDAPEGMAGVGGTFHWYVTSDTPGDYQFTAYEMPPAGDEPTGRVIVPIEFAKKAADLPDPVVLFTVEKTGITYNIGDTMEVILGVQNGTKLYVKECDAGISIDTKEITVKHGDKELTCSKFTVTALKDGNHTFSIGIDLPVSSNSGLDNVIYEDTMHVAKTGAEPMTPRGVFTQIGEHPPLPGEYVEISIRGNATTGYKWVSAENKDLIISDSIYIPDEAPEGMVGVGGTYHWYVTADKPGEYEFTAYEMPPAGDEPTGRAIVPVVFAKKAD
ncbi:MAG: protease inhibitor I42 family protein [Methanocorpusculum sp.]|nr:protease inhibitor I42 family protein [Methanocorpusculum sp.]HJJ44702.1 protease inhibitor I42 family protein [Methanocorpusculum sp.]